MVAFDATILLPLFFPNVPVPLDRMTGKPVDYFKERIEYLIATIEKDHTKILVPTPALSELLVYAGKDGPEHVRLIRQSPAFKVENFDERAAIEAASLTAEAFRKYGNKRGGIDATWAKIKFDRQIIAIAKVNGASAIYSDDPDVKAMSIDARVTVITLAELALPPSTAQGKFDFKASGTTTEPEMEAKPKS
jgi:hypothetical protein